MAVVVGELVCTLGDLLLDVVVRLEGPLPEGDDAHCETHLSTGGQAANVAAWAVALGGRARLIARRAQDGAGRLAEEGLAARGVEAVGPTAEGRGGVVVSLVAPDGERTMLSDRGVAAGLRAADLDPAWLDGCSHLHISGYALMREPMASAAAAAATTARRQGARVAVDLASAHLIRQHGVEEFAARLAAIAPDLVLATEEEAGVFGGDPPAPAWLVKRGARGVRGGARDGTRFELPAAPAQVVDATGAGDAFAAGAALGGSLDDMARRGLGAAACCIARVGAMP